MEYTIKLNVQHLQAINQALVNAPYHLAAPVITELQKQISEQEAAMRGTGMGVQAGTVVPPGYSGHQPEATSQ